MRKLALYILMSSLLAGVSVGQSVVGGSNVVVDDDGNAPVSVGNDKLSISRGLVGGVSHINKFGYNPTCDAGDDVWGGGQLRKGLQ